MFEVNEKVVIITGGCGGIGSALCKGFYGQGAKVYSTDITEPEKNVPYEFIKANLMKEEDLKKIVNTVIKKEGRIDALINCAAITRETWDVTIATNLTAPYKLAKLVADHMIKKKIKGSIINIGSLASIVGFAGNPQYTSAKGGITSMTRALANEWSKYGIRVNAVHPGYFKTSMNKASLEDPVLYKQRVDQTMLGRWGEPEEMVGVCVFLASNDSSYITGANIVVDGGWTVKGM
jgi:NAD(P)-dependent dehydrogenase (short-subunit alcohol dehydrogenase family)